VKPPLILAIGNPSRGDDALGPAFADAIRADADRAGLEVLVDFQLQIEHALDLVERPRVWLVDASASAPAPCAFVDQAPDDAGPPLSHALTPGQVLAACRAFGAPPPCTVLAIRGASFSLGDGLSRVARGHLAAALELFRAELAGGDRVVARRLGVEGVVQGVGFRPFLHRLALRLGLRGVAWNGASGVTARLVGPASAVRALVTALATEAPPGARIDAVTLAPDAFEADGFAIVDPPPDEAGPGLALLPDAAPCADCLQDLAGPGPYAGWPLTSCAVCGPRFAITTTLPWSRAGTTLAGFPLCPACAARDADPADRRFRAEGSTCPRCGPPVTWTGGGEPVEGAARCVAAGGVIAVVGVGAVHLVCDATDEAAVARLRALKRRETRPFAVLVADEGDAQRRVQLDEDAVATLCSPARPIVVAAARPSHGLAPGVAPGTARLGVMLPYSPLHHRLVRALGRPLVVTSANASGHPAAVDVAGLDPRVDGVLAHGRRIARRVEDSVVLVGASGPRVVRRARGYAPTSFRLPVSAPEPILALGGHHKTAVCVVIGDTAHLGPHLGDLDTRESEDAFATEVESFERLLGVRCAILAHDLHPDYATTRYARGRGGRSVAVQHHAAHAFAALAESGLDEPVVVLVLDGTGWGTDGTSWGTELLVVDGADAQRLASARPLRLPGGERAIREVWRTGLAALHDAFPDDLDRLDPFLPCLRSVPASDRDVVLRMLDAGVNTPPARGLGRWFDAWGWMILGRPTSRHEAEVALALEEVATGASEPWTVGLPERLALDGSVGSAHELDLRPVTRGVVTDLGAGRPPGFVAARVHDTVVDALATLAERALVATGARRVLGTGGALANQRLAAGLAARLGSRWWTPRSVPANDGGLALGQVWAAAHAAAADPRGRNPTWRTALSTGTVRGGQEGR
jgi:hydrogenase maturation protein HypF